MASHSNQYIFGEFSPDEFNQFFVTPRCYVELPPFLDKVSCVSQPTGEGYEHIEFGVDEVMDQEPITMKDSMYKVSSTLNPQAPEFILGCQPPQKALQTLPASDCADCPDSDLPPLDENQALGSLAQRERKKKKKRPPGYYNYLEGPSGAQARADGLLGAGLVNGHVANAPTMGSEDTVGEVRVPKGSPGHGPSSPVTPAPASAVDQRTCQSPVELPRDFVDRTALLTDGNDTTAPSRCGGAEGRTAERQPDPLAPGDPEPPGSERQSPALPIPSAAPAPDADLSSTSTTRLEAAHTMSTTDGAGSGAANGQTEPDSSEAGDLPPLPAVTSERPDDGAQPPVASAPPALVAPQLKSWASLFHNSKPLPGGPQAYVEVRSSPAAVSPGPALGPAPAPAPTPTPTAEKAGEANEGPVPVSEDPLAPRLAELISNVKLIHKPVSLQPRGLINKGNWCYINAPKTLQALVACPPMYHLMKSIPMLSETRQPRSSTPIIHNFVRLVNEFSNMPLPSKAKQQAAGEKMIKEIRPGVPFEPNYIYKLLTVIKSSLSEKGRPEDAEEYLGFILNGLHEEMLALKKLLSPHDDPAVSTLNGPASRPGAEEDAAEREDGGSEDEWEQVGPRNRASVMRQAGFVQTPITDIFGGLIRSVVYQQSSKESATLQPFFTLQLDIQSEKIRTVQEALETLVARESVQGYTTKTKQEVEICRRVTLEELPPVLVLHLKRFVFEKTGGCQKLLKTVDYPVDLEISKDLLSPVVRSKISKVQRTYRLFAVVYHHGNSATGGHYTTDVFHIGLSGWLRIDDQAVKAISQYQVVKQSGERTAYLLYYRRVDLLSDRGAALL